MKILLTIIFCLFTSLSWAGNYIIATGTSAFDGDTDCGGACDSTDTITIAGGARGSLTLRDINGGAGYISIQNDAVDRVVLTGRIQIDNCKYIDLSGDGLAGTTYGIKVINNTNVSGAVKIVGQSDHVKLSYIEIDDQSTLNMTSGFFVQDATEAATHIWDTIEIHHNYIHGTRYAGMYLGQNYPATEDNPYISNVSVHDNIMEDIGAYGMVIKGVHSTSGTCSIYNNKITTTGIVYSDDGDTGSGMSVHTFDGTNGSNIYGNYIANTTGACIRAGAQYHNIYDNICLNNGTSNNSTWGHGIVLYYQSCYNEVYDNIIIQPTRYGIYAASGAYVCGSTASRNLIGDAGVGEIYENSGRIVESSPPNANIYHADVASWAFDTWSNDSNYSNDVFGGRGLDPPNGATGVATSVTLTGTLFTGVSTVDVYFECGDATPDVLVIDDGAAISYEPSELGNEQVCYWQTIYTHGWGTETGAVYSFTTTEQLNPPTPTGSVRYHKKGPKFQWLKKGSKLR